MSNSKTPITLLTLVRIRLMLAITSSVARTVALFVGARRASH